MNFENRKARRARQKRERKEAKNSPLLALVEYDAMTAKPCVLCGEYTHSRGVFNPNEPERYGAPRGKYTFIVYALCEDESLEQDAVRIQKYLAAKIALANVDSYSI